MVMRAGSSLFLIITSHHLRRVQQGRRHIRRNPRRHAPIRRNIRPTALQASTSLHDGRTATVGILDAPSLSQTPTTHQTTEPMKSRIIRFHILLSTERKTSIMTPNAATSVLPVIRHILNLPLIVRYTTSRMLRQIHQNALGMGRNRLPVHGNFGSHVDRLPNLALKTSADARFVENTDPRTKRLERLQWLRLMVKPNEDM